jgi:hypothetical protein
MFFEDILSFAQLDLSVLKDISKTLPKNLVFTEEKNKHDSHEQCLYCSSQKFQTIKYRI